ncbi:MAG TPA: M23 family metallopeptidase [Gemmatimonadota bacterium]|nr:M23 family metallopeptidase [Gemmatimonadota bacterium]
MSRWSRIRTAALTASSLAAVAACAPVYSESAPPASGAAAIVRQAPTPLVRALETLVWPLAADGSALLRSRYGNRLHPLGGDPRFHTGLDLRAPLGTPVYASADGTVSASESSGAYGNVVILDHAGGLQTLYAHHQRNLVGVDDRVRRGQPIALVGHTGNATGDHLHFEVRWNGGTVDPRTVLPLLSGTVAR